MTTPYTLIQDVAHQSEPPADGTLSRTLHQDEQLKAVLFNFSSGQELSEHTAARPAIVNILVGQAELVAGGETYRAGPGSWLRMAVGTPHAIRATTAMVMALYLLSAPQAADTV